MKLYFAPNSRAVRIAWLLEELGLEYEVEKYTVGDRALRTPEYYKIHPMGRIPVLEDGETRIYESGAIVQYLLLGMEKENLCQMLMIPLSLNICNGCITQKAQLWGK